MKEKQLIIKTKRLKLYPLSDSELQQLINECTDEKLAAAYTQMLEGSRSNPGCSEKREVWH